MTRHRGLRSSSSQHEKVHSDGNIIINELLCFAVNKMDILPFEVIVKLCVDAFDDRDIEAAKRLLYDMCGDCSSHRFKRRQGLNKSQSNVQDILTLLHEIEPENIPCFVAKDVSKLPPVNFDHIDVSTLLSQMNQVKLDIDSLKQGIDSMSRLYLTTSNDIRELKAKMCGLSPEKCTTAESGRPKSDLSVDDSDMSIQSKLPIVDAPDGDQPPGDSMSSVVCECGVNEHENPALQQQLISATESSQDQTDSAMEMPEDGDNDGFTTVTYSHRRRRHQSYADVVVSGQTINSESSCKIASAPSLSTRRNLIEPAQPTTQVTSRRKYMLGKRKHSGLIPATPQKKRVFVSRLRPDTNAENLIRYIKDTMHVDVADCERLPTKYNSYASFASLLTQILLCH
ncbi:uncharacterized protein [Ptychodera flava]|uniref:uncharacterized protein n=1 Tax=Ptychodera flava TaxID=63121 RepID=UPI00396AAC6D